MINVRKPVVAGMFYPEHKDTLSAEVIEMLAKADIPDLGNDILGVVSPHAGYMYSGHCAAYAYKALALRSFDLAVIIAPSHHFTGYKYSVGDFSAYETPLGTVKVDTDITSVLRNKYHFDFIQQAHQREHSLEVQLPFLQVINPQAAIVPIVISLQQSKNSEYLAETLIEVLGDRISSTVFIASSDLSHYHTGEMAQVMDMTLASYIEHLDTSMVQKSIQNGSTEACGFGSILTLMHLAKNLQYNQVKNLMYMHSGQVSGDNLRVVGYLSSVFYKQGL